MKIATETLLFVGPKIRFVDFESLAKFSLRTTHIHFIATCALQQVDHISVISRWCFLFNIIFVGN